MSPCLCLSSPAFLLNHSREYHGALAAGLIEFILESYFFPSLKYPSSPYIMWFGLIIVGVGQFVRTLAMFTAASNFTHLVAEYKTPNHKLVTHGIYRYEGRGEIRSNTHTQQTTAKKRQHQMIEDEACSNTDPPSDLSFCLAQPLSSSILCRLVLVECRHTDTARESNLYRSICHRIIPLL